ncbi:MAG: hypothetical protein JXN62_02130 [Bacteroidales bacterium]|nr:hypothetical protein [Bacteroidales bacterium]
MTSGLRLTENIIAPDPSRLFTGNSVIDAGKQNIDDATKEYERFINMIIGFKEEGLSAAVYTQWTDVENEMNGIYTYDRKVIKFHKSRIKTANESTY